MKKLSIAFALLLVVTLGSVFAEGSQEQAPVPGTRFSNDYNGQLLELTGRVELPGYGHIELNSDGEKYELMVPMYLLDNVEIEDGETVTVEGYLVPGPRWEEEEDEQYLAVTKATVDGEEYDLDFARGPRVAGRRGSYGPMMGGRRGYCWDDGTTDGDYGPGRGGSRGGYRPQSRGRW